MAKFAPNTFFDAALATVSAGNRMLLLPSQPADYAAADAAKLAQATMAGGDFTLGAGTPSGRALTVAAKTGLASIAAGTGNHVAIVNTATSALLYVTTCDNVVVANPGTVNIPSWTITIPQAA